MMLHHSRQVHVWFCLATIYLDCYVNASLKNVSISR